MSGLTTHVLDTSAGRPASGVRVDVSEVGAGGVARLIRSLITDADGRARMLEGDELRRGSLELTFHVADYFRGSGATLTDPPFYDQIPVRFTVAVPDRHHHVPLLVSPFGYVTYRGS